MSDVREELEAAEMFQDRERAEDIAELVAALRDLASNGDTEVAHGEADDLLLKFIGDDEVTAAYNAIDKWYA